MWIQRGRRLRGVAGDTQADVVGTSAVLRMRGKAVACFLHLYDRVACLARLMESEGRIATWQQLDENRFILREHNCPFHRLNGRFDHPCRREVSLLERTLQADVQRVNHIMQGDVACVYRIECSGNGNRCAKKDGVPPQNGRNASEKAERQEHFRIAVT